MNCSLLTQSKEICLFCKSHLSFERKYVQNKIKKIVVSAKLNAPVTQTEPRRLLLTIQDHRKKNKKLTQEVKMLQSEIDNSSVPVNEDFNNDFQFIFRNCDQNKISPFMKLFWEEQIKYLNSSSQIRYHPMVIKY